MSASVDMKLSESVHGRLEDLLEVECLVGDICTRKHKTKQNKCKNTKQSTNLIRFKLVQKKYKNKNLTQNITMLKQNAIRAKS